MPEDSDESLSPGTEQMPIAGPSSNAVQQQELEPQEAPSEAGDEEEEEMSSASRPALSPNDLVAWPVATDDSHVRMPYSDDPSAQNRHSTVCTGGCEMLGFVLGRLDLRTVLESLPWL